MCPVPNAQVKMTQSSNEQGWVTLIQTIVPIYNLTMGAFSSIHQPVPARPPIARRLQHRGHADERSQ